jgi:hypothetical protein
MIKIATLTVGAFISITALPSVVIAGDPAFCAVYANQAVAQSAMNMQQQCGFGGARWLNDYSAHFGWCLTVPNNMAAGERNARIAQLQQCANAAQNGGSQKPSLVKYSEPMIAGMRLDWCRVWAGECGKPAADAFCKAKGHSTAMNFKQASDIGAFAPTKVISTGQVCTDNTCDGFAWINCAD